jgi:hypothetical protein
MATALFQNLLVVFILLSLFIIIYCKMTGKTIKDIILDIRGGLTAEV